MAAVTAREIQKIDRIAIEKCGIPPLILMENAGGAVAREICRDFRKKSGLKVCVFCGTGNNGGDGFVAARHLASRGARVRVFLVGNTGQLKPDAAVNARILKYYGCRVEKVDAENNELVKAIKSADVIIDALFGVGLNRDLGEPWVTLINKINCFGRPVYAVDVPSGLDATTGKILGTAIKADKTVTFTCAKTGFYRGQGPRHVGKAVVAEIGIPIKVTKSQCHNDTYKYREKFFL